MKKWSFVFAALTVFSGVVDSQPSIQPVVAGYTFPGPALVAPGQVVTLFVRGLNAANGVANSAPWPTVLSGISVSVKNPVQGYPTLLPIFSILSYPGACAGEIITFCDTTAVTVQIPTESTCTSPVPDGCTNGPSPVITVSIEQNGVAVQEFQFHAVPGIQPHILNPCDTIMAQFGACYPIITHANGHLISDGEPARPGETIVLYAVGLGPTNPTVKSGAPAPAPAPVTDLVPPLTLSFELDAAGSQAGVTLWVPTGQLIRPAFAGLVPGFVGLYQVNFAIPSALPAQLHRCQGFADVNTRIFIGQGVGQGQTRDVESADICVQP